MDEKTQLQRMEKLLRDVLAIADFNKHQLNTIATKLSDDVNIVNVC